MLVKLKPSRVIMINLILDTVLEIFYTHHFDSSSWRYCPLTGSASVSVDLAHLLLKKVLLEAVTRRMNCRAVQRLQAAFCAL